MSENIRENEEMKENLVISQGNNDSSNKSGNEEKNDIQKNIYEMETTNKERESKIEGPRTSYLKKIDVKNFYFQTNKFLKVIFWIFLCFSIAATIALIILKVGIVTKLLGVFIFLVLIFVLGILPYGIEVSLVVETKSVNIAKKITLPLKLKCQSTSYKLIDIKEFKFDSNVINSEYSQYTIIMKLKKGKTITILDKWGLRTEFDETLAINKNLNKFLGDARKSQLEDVPQIEINEKQQKENNVHME